MKSLRYDTGFAAASLILSTALAIDWLGGMFLKTPFIARCGMLGLAIIMSGSAVLAVMSRGQRAHEALRRCFGALCQSENLVPSADAQPKLPVTDTEWIVTFCRVRDVLARYATRAQELEQSHAALEVRARRNEARAQRVETILAGLPEPVIAINDYDEVILSNVSANRLLEIDVRGTEERALRCLVHCEQLVELLTETRRRKGPTQRTSELELPDEHGRMRWYSVTARSVRALGSNPDDSEGQGVVAVLRDVSVQKAAQRRNAEFVSAVSHEMKTPLAGIKAYTELLVDGDAEDDATRDEFLQVISGQANRLQRLVDNLLNLARIEAGVVTVSKESRPLNELLDEALSIVHPAAEAKQITLVRDLSPMYLGVFADRDMMLQAAINLLSNAVKYTASGGRVTIRSRLLDTEVCFEVEDTGVGLRPEDHQKVFEKFYRVQGSKEMSAGTGLGLPLAKHIVEDVHGGRLTVESEFGQGSVFRVTLPSAGQIGS
jgi:two-component system phosphate regulon sensor histidine kinase PhoR